MILYIQTPAIPRSDLHNHTIKGMIEYLDTCNQFDEIRWFINIDAIRNSNINNAILQWEDVSITRQNFEYIASNLTNTSVSIRISYEPCFYLAFRSLTYDVINDVDSNNFKDSDFCVLWLEDDWIFTNTTEFNTKLDMFLSDTKYKIYTLHINKINMGGNPDIIKGDIFNLFRDINLDINNKRDPENIRKHDVWYPNVFIDPTYSTLDILPYNRLLNQLIDINNNINHPVRTLQVNAIHSNVVNGDIGDQWRGQLTIRKNWSGQDKHGISANRSYTYQ